MERFAERHGFLQPNTIIYRADLPEPIVRAIVQILFARTSERFVRDACVSLFDPFLTGDRFRYSEHSSMSFLKWYEVFSLIEHVSDEIAKDDRKTLLRFQKHSSEPSVFPNIMVNAPSFRDEINRLFIHEGIGWQLDGEGKIISRGDENFTEALEGAISKLDDTKRPTAAEHLKLSLQALSQRPTANTAGAVSHATSAVECVLHDITGKPRTLSAHLAKEEQLFNPLIKEALAKIYGYASGQGGARHGREGALPAPEEARFIVATCAAVCTLLAETNSKK